MSSGKAAEQAGETAPGTAPQSGGKRKLLLIALPALLAVGAGGLWFSGTLPKLLGLAGKKPAATATAALPVFVTIPELIANLDAGVGRTSFVKLGAKLEVPTLADAKRAEAVMPRIVDLFQTYLRDMRPADFQGSEGTWRLREALLARAEIALAPGHVRDVLFTQILVQ